MNTHSTIPNDVKMSSICGQSAWVFIRMLIPIGIQLKSLLLNQISGFFEELENPSETKRSAFYSGTIKNSKKFN